MEAECDHVGCQSNCRMRKYFVQPQSTPSTLDPYPFQETVVSFLQHKDFHECFIAVTENGPNFKYFYCSRCRSWKSLGTSIGHVKMHFDTRGHNDAKFFEEHKLSREWQEKLIKNIQLFILANGYPFSMIEDSHLQIVPELPHRKQLKDISLKMAEKLRSTIKSILNRCEYCTFSLDEWSDILRRRYLGISCHTRLEGSLKVLFIAHISLDKVIQDDARDHYCADDIAFIIDEVAKGYDVCDKLILIVTDRASVMSLAAQKYNDIRISRNQLPVLWCGCVCHIVNSLLSKFISELLPLFKPIMDIQKRLSHSEVFTSFLMRKGSEQVRIPGYCEVRWYSLFKMLKAFKKLKPMIIEFYNVEYHEVIQADIWTTVEDFTDVTRTIKTITKALEGELFSTISLVLTAFKTIYNQFQQLSKKAISYAEVFDHWKDYYKKLVSEAKQSWHPLLEVATFLHPGLVHRTILSQTDMQCVIEFLQSNDGTWKAATILQAIRQAADSKMTPRTVETYYHFPAVEELQSIKIPSSRPMNNVNVQTHDALTDLMNLSNAMTPSEPAQTTTIGQEINAYLAYCQAGLSPVSFWRENQSRFPKLSNIANKIMSIIPSSAATERQFSSSKRLQGLRRAHMNEEVFEDQVLLGSNPEIAEELF